MSGHWARTYVELPSERVACSACALLNPASFEPCTPLVYDRVSKLSFRVTYARLVALAGVYKMLMRQNKKLEGTLVLLRGNRRKVSVQLKFHTRAGESRDARRSRAGSRILPESAIPKPERRGRGSGETAESREFEFRGHNPKTAARMRTLPGDRGFRSLCAAARFPTSIRFSPEAMRFLGELAQARNDGIDIERASTTWSTSSFTSWTTRPAATLAATLAVQWGVAIEIERAIKKSASF